jgi:hypothetical protein
VLWEPTATPTPLNGTVLSELSVAQQSQFPGGCTGGVRTEPDRHLDVLPGCYGQRQAETG